MDRITPETTQETGTSRQEHLSRIAAAQLLLSEQAAWDAEGHIQRGQE